MSDTHKHPKTIREKEEATIAFWKEKKIFEKSLKHPGGKDTKESFSFYDGPPFATGLPHMGNILAGIIKDTIPRYQTMNGKQVPRVWGWDCHGLPIENLIEKKLQLASKKDIESYGVDKFNKAAYESVLTYDNEWKDVIPRFGRFVNMEHPYKTMDATYTESVWWSWKTLYEKKLAYEGSKMMHICPRCETPLAQSEVGLNYEDVTDLSVTAKFELVDEPGTYVLAWTTTPWTLPGNTALALHKEATYVKVANKENGEHYIIAEEVIKSGGSLWNQFLSYQDTAVTYKGSDLVGKSYKPVFPYFIDREIENKENIWKIWHADFITLDTGTGVAHEAPAFGADDMELAKLHNIPIIKHVRMDGTFVDAITDESLKGMKVKVAGDTQSADIEIIKWLAHNGKLFEKHKIVHSYPLCWRCKTPLLNYATSSWFVDVPQMKEKLLKENESIGWTPSHVRDGRFGKWLEGAREWAVSRARYWGAPLPVWKNKDGSEVKVIGSLKELSESSKHKAKNTYYVIRHGESMSNVQNIMDKGTDANNHLTEEGKKQVSASVQTLKDCGVDIIVSSPVLRAQETAAIASEVLGVPVTTDANFTEFDMGIYSGKTRDEYACAFSDDSFLSLDVRPEGGETHRELLNRVMKGVMDLEKNYEGKTILIVTHGGPARMLFMGGHLLTEEELLYNEEHEGGTLYPKNAEVKELVLKLVPRDETGAVNLHRPYIDEVELLDSKGETMKRILDVFDCWYESGAMPFASVHYPFENKELFDKSYPADFIAEGIDQTRGWFYSLINLGVGLFDKAPYKHVIVNGLVLAESGKKLSKSEANYTDPVELVNTYGADAVRYFLLSSPVVKGENVLFADKSIEEVYKKLITRLENVVSLYEMNKNTAVVAKGTSTHVLDVWVMSRLHELMRDATKGYDTYNLDEAIRPLESFIDDVSVWYVRRSRSRLKGDSGEEDKIQALETLAYTLCNLSLVMAPSMPFLAERIYQKVKDTKGGHKESVHLESWPKVGTIATDVLEHMKNVREVVSLALMVRTKEAINVRQPLLLLKTNVEIPKEYYEVIMDEVNVKKINIDTSAEEKIYLNTELTDDLIREGDVRNLIRAVQDGRKEAKLQPRDEITLRLSVPYDLGSLDELKKTCNVKEIILERVEGGNSAELSKGVAKFTITR